jgi:hypothetical protein
LYLEEHWANHFDYSGVIELNFPSSFLSFIQKQKTMKAFLGSST